MPRLLDNLELRVAAPVKPPSVSAASADPPTDSGTKNIKMISLHRSTPDLQQEIAACEAKITTANALAVAGLEAVHIEQGRNPYEYSELIKQEGTRDFITTVAPKWVYTKPAVCR